MKVVSIKIKQIMKKIGSVEKDRGLFVPTESDRKEFINSKMIQLKK